MQYEMMKSYWLALLKPVQWALWWSFPLIWSNQRLELWVRQVAEIKWIVTWALGVKILQNFSVVWQLVVGLGWNCCRNLCQILKQISLLQTHYCWEVQQGMIDFLLFLMSLLLFHPCCWRQIGLLEFHTTPELPAVGLSAEAVEFALVQP